MRAKASRTVYNTTSALLCRRLLNRISVLSSRRKKGKAELERERGEKIFYIAFLYKYKRASESGLNADFLSPPFSLPSMQRHDGTFI